MAADVTIKLVQNYALRPSEAKLLEERGDDAGTIRRNLSEQFITLAVAKVHGQEMGRKDAKVYRGIRRQLDEETPELRLNATEAEWFFDLFLGATAESKVVIPPAWASWFLEWVDYLEAERAAFKAA